MESTILLEVKKVKLSRKRPWRPKGCEMLWIPHCLDNRLIDGGKAVSPTHRPYFTPQKHYYLNVSGTHFCSRLTKPQGLVRPEGLGKFKNSPHRVSNPRTFRHYVFSLVL
jgi:hypothetical protein